MQELSTEIFYLFLTTLVCGVLWIPYVCERFIRIGIKNQGTLTSGEAYYSKHKMSNISVKLNV